MSRAKKKAAAPTEPTIRVTLAPSIIEVRRLELGTVRRQLAEKAGELAELAGATKRAKAAVVELTARQEQLVAAVADGAEDQPQQADDRRHHAHRLRRAEHLPGDLRADRLFLADP